MVEITEEGRKYGLRLPPVEFKPIGMPPKIPPPTLPLKEKPTGEDLELELVKELDDAIRILEHINSSTRHSNRWTMEIKAVTKQLKTVRSSLR